MKPTNPRFRVKNLLPSGKAVLTQISSVDVLPGVMAYGTTKTDAVAKVQALALRVLAERMERGEAVPELLSVSFQ